MGLNPPQRAKLSLSVKILIQVFFIVLTMTPTWIFLGARTFLDPQGFWQNFILFGVGVYILGTTQAGLGVALLLVSFIFWTSDL